MIKFPFYKVYLFYRNGKKYEYAFFMLFINAGNFKKALEYAKKNEKEAADLDDYKSIYNGLRVSAMSYAMMGFDKEVQEMINEFAMQAKEVYDENAEKYKKQYKENYAIDFTEIDSKVLENGDFESKMKFSSENLIDRIGKKMIINPMLFLSKNSNEFDQTEERKFRIEFTSSYAKVKKIILEIPDGYVIEEMPKNKKIVTEDKEIEYNYKVEQKGSIIEVTSITKVLSAEYPKEYYPALKKIWETASKNENQVISLIKNNF